MCVEYIIHYRCLDYLHDGIIGVCVTHSELLACYISLEYICFVSLIVQNIVRLFILFPLHLGYV